MLSCRPLFVAEAEFRAAKVFTRVKKCMLVLTGADMLVINVAALEAAEAAAAGGDMSLAVLRLISYREVREVLGRCADLLLAGQQQHA
jgi:hypothetical protein